MRSILLAVLCAVALPLHAATVNVSWTNPVQYADNTPLAAADIASTRIEYGSCNGTAFGAKAGEVTATGSATSTTVDRPPGTWCYRAYTRVTAAKGGGESGASNVAQGVVPFPDPKSPSGLTVNVTVTVTVAP